MVQQNKRQFQKRSIARGFKGNLLTIAASSTIRLHTEKKLSLAELSF